MRYHTYVAAWLMAAVCVVVGAQSDGVMTLDGLGIRDVAVPEPHE